MQIPKVVESVALNQTIIRAFFCHFSDILWRCDRVLTKVEAANMSLFAHIEELSEKHQFIHRQIELEMSRPLVDSLKVSELKRRKLRLKEKIEKLKNERQVA
jgi:hypothetical protein